MINWERHKEKKDKERNSTFRNNHNHRQLLAVKHVAYVLMQIDERTKSHPK